MGSQTVHQECLIVKHSRQVDLLYLEKKFPGTGFLLPSRVSIVLVPLIEME